MGRTTGAAGVIQMQWSPDKPIKPGFYWMKVHGLRIKVVEITDHEPHGLCILQTRIPLSHLPEHDRTWAGPLEPPP